MNAETVRERARKHNLGVDAALPCALPRGGTRTLGYCARRRTSSAGGTVVGAMTPGWAPAPMPEQSRAARSRSSPSSATGGGRAQRTRGARGGGCFEQPSGPPGRRSQRLFAGVTRPSSPSARENAGPGRRARHPTGAVTEVLPPEAEASTLVTVAPPRETSTLVTETSTLVTVTPTLVTVAPPRGGRCQAPSTNAASHLERVPGCSPECRDSTSTGGCRRSHAGKADGTGWGASAACRQGP